MNAMRSKQTLLCAALLAGASTAFVAAAQQYPSRPLRIIVPFPPGGASDVIARLLSARLTEIRACSRPRACPNPLLRGCTAS
jgi:tripartite-type tricarboxylate transporter receptor subunit TctC